MLRFEVRELYLESMGLYFLPLPKLTGTQIRFLARHLEDRGFSVRVDTKLSARSGSNTISVDPAGLARSSEGSLDALAPAVPELLRFPSEKVSFNPYFSASKVRDGYAVRLSTRMESSSLWAALRGAGQCALTPDEALIVQGLLRNAAGEIECVTDYPTDGGSPLIAGRRTYYRSRVPVAEFAANLRTLTHTPRKSCYLVKQATLTVHARTLSSARLSPEIRDWCFLDL